MLAEDHSVPDVSDRYSLFFFFSSTAEENLHVGMVISASGEKQRFIVSPDGVWEQAVVTRVVFLVGSECDLFKCTV